MHFLNTQVYILSNKHDLLKKKKQNKIFKRDCV